MKLCQLLSAAGAATLARAVDIRGLTFPTAVTYDAASGRVFIAEKSGVIKTAASWNVNQTEAAAFVDIRSQVASFQYGGSSELGLTSIAAASGYVYGLYAVWDPANNGKDCTGAQPIGVPAENISGCPTAGRLSRWAIRPNGTAGPEEILLDGRDKMCSQFVTLGADNVEMGPDGYLYVSTGVGANENEGLVNGTDYGQFGATHPGGDPCTNSSVGSWGGAFRAQLNGTWGGKVVRVHPVSLNVTVVARGLHNPWRFAFLGSHSLLVTDTSEQRGPNSTEEVNGPIDIRLPFGPNGTGAPNYGYPCYSGAAVNHAYTNLSSSLCAGLAVSPPLYSYTAARFGASSASVSALGVRAGRVFLGDYSLGRIWSVNAAGADAVTHATGLFPVDIADTGSELVYVDVGTGRVASIPNQSNGALGGPSVLSLVTALAAAAVVTLLSAAW